MSGGTAADGEVLCVVGTRPEAIKLAPVVIALAALGIPVAVCSTGQHRDLVRVALADFGLAAEVDLDLMTDKQTPAGFLATALPAVTAIIGRRRPAVVMVQGDTASTLSGALAAAYARVPIAHVEAGLRSQATEPFPEDLHRRLVAQTATFHFAPTPAAAAALIAEGIDPLAITTTGNTVIDAVEYIERRVARTRPRAEADEVSAITAGARPLIVVTAHRRENHARMPAIAAAVSTIARGRDCDIVVALHPHPAAGGVLRAALSDVPNIVLAPPLGYVAFLTLLRRARLVLTDSGGVQEEGPALGCPVLVLREITERPEGIAAGAARLVGTDPPTIVAAAFRLIDDDAAHAAMARAVRPYGDGTAAQRIADVLSVALGNPLRTAAA